MSGAARMRRALAGLLLAGLASLAFAPDAECAVSDRRLAEEFEELNERGRETLLIRFWDAYPELRAKGRGGRDGIVARMGRR